MPLKNKYAIFFIDLSTGRVDLAVEYAYTEEAAKANFNDKYSHIYRIVEAKQVQQ